MTATSTIGAEMSQGKIQDERALHTCSICRRCFSSTRHLARHMHIHTDGHRYSCQACGETFQRSDVLRRHALRSCPGRKLNGEPSTGRRTAKRTKVRQACDWCHDRKLKCDGRASCSNCIARERECTYQRLPNPNPNPLDGIAPQHSSGQPAALPASLDSDIEEIDNAAHLRTSIDLAPNFITHSSSSAPSINLSNPFAANDLGDLWNPGLADLFMLDIDFDFGLPESFPDPMESPSKDLAMERLKVEITASSRVALSASVEPWLKRPFIPRQYDLEVLEELVKVALQHLRSVFASFRDFDISSEANVSQIVAMAAVGAAFVSYPGTETMSRLLFSDSQRMATLELERTDALSLVTSTSLLQTYICLFVFGMCSGQKRSYELSQAYHEAFLQVESHHHRILNEQREVSRACDYAVLDDFLILEGYRAMLLRLQPSLPSHRMTFFHKILSNYRPNRTTASESANPAAHSDPSQAVYRDLCCIGSLSWFASTRPQWFPSTEMRTWRVETMEIYLNSLMDQHHEILVDNPSTQSLLYTLMLDLYAPLICIRDLASWLLRWSEHSAQRSDIPRHDLLFELEKWSKSDKYLTAMANVDAILGSTEERLHKCDALPEAPHDLMCSYLATLVSVVARLVSSPPDRIQRGLMSIKALRSLGSTTLSYALTLLNEAVDTYLSSHRVAI